MTASNIRPCAGAYNRLWVVTEYSLRYSSCAILSNCILRTTLADHSALWQTDYTISCTRFIRTHFVPKFIGCTLSRVSTVHRARSNSKTVPLNFSKLVHRFSALRLFLKERASMLFEHLEWTPVCQAIRYGKIPYDNKSTALVTANYWNHNIVLKSKFD